MPRRRWMTEKRDIVRRLQAQQSIRSISSETGMHRVTVRKIREVAETCGWLAPGAELPTEQEIAAFLKATKKRTGKHPLDAIREKIEGWVKNGYTYTAIHTMVQDYQSCSEVTVRRYILRTFPKYRKPVVARRHLPGRRDP